MFKKALFLLITVVICLNSISFAFSDDFVTLTDGSRAKILEIIDGQAFKVQPVGTANIALVKLIGVEAWNDNTAIEYLKGFLGKEAQLSFDPYLPKSNDRYNLMYLYVDGSLINGMLIERGLAKVDKTAILSNIYHQLIQKEFYAVYNRLGLWANENAAYNYQPPYYWNDSYYGYNYWNPPYNYSYYQYPQYNAPTYSQPTYSATSYVNINTASASFLSANLFGVSSNLANNIVSYRQDNPFTTIYEIKHVDGFNPDIFSLNAGIMTVSTNINKASSNEMLSLGIGQSYITNLLHSRNSREFTGISELYTRSLIARSEFDKIEPFISTTTKTSIDYAIPKNVVNINKGTQSQISAVGLNSVISSAIISGRKNGYSYKHIGELAFIPQVMFKKVDIDNYEDNLTTITNINAATSEELRSVLGTSANNTDIQKLIANKPFKTLNEIENLITSATYKALKPYIYLDTRTTDYINLNCATKEQLSSVGFSESAVNSIYSRRKTMDKPADIPVNVSDYDMKVTLYTNINLASRNELNSLSTNMTPAILDEIISYRMLQPFGNDYEVENFFASSGRLSLYNEFRNYVIVR